MTRREYYTSYLIHKYKGVYRLKTPVDLSTNTFPREFDGKFAENDIYIDCMKDVKVFYYGHSVLEAYIPSIPYGRNIIRIIYYNFVNPNNVSVTESEMNVKGVSTTRKSYSIIDEQMFVKEVSSKDCIIFDIDETDTEVMFKFKGKDSDKILPLLKPKTFGSSISPFSSRNLPKTKYTIPDEDLLPYKKMVAKIPQNNLLLIKNISTDFLKSMTNRRYTYDDLKADMVLKGLKSKEYIHSIGKWNDYMKYMEDRICQS